MTRPASVKNLGRPLRRKEAAARIGRSYYGLIDLVKAGKVIESRLPSARGHRSLPVYFEAHLDAFLASGYTTAPRRRTA